MKKSHILIALLLFVFVSCGKDDESTIGLTGNWQSSEHYFLIKTNEEFDFVDLFGKPWIGTLKINGVDVETGNLNYLIDNALGDHHLYSDKIQFTLYNDMFVVYYLNEIYQFNDNYTIDLKKGSFVANGTAINSSKQIAVDINLSAQHITMAKDVTYAITDGLYYLSQPFYKLSFQEDGTLGGTMMDIDVLFNFTGTWSKKSNQLNLGLMLNDRTINYDYAFQVIEADTLTLTKEIEYSNQAVYASIPLSKINKLQYESVFVRN
jgi:hypothetical protein